MNHEIYADHAATAPIEPLALEAMYTAYQEYANPAALYRSALHTKQTVEKARLTVAGKSGLHPRPYIFHLRRQREQHLPSVARCRRAAMWSQRPSSTTRF